MNFFEIMLLMVKSFFSFSEFIYYYLLFLLDHLIREYLTICRKTLTNPILILVGLDSSRASIYFTALQQIWPLIALK